MNLVVLQGLVRDDPVARSLSSGQQVMSFELAVRSVDETLESVPIVLFDSACVVVSRRRGGGHRSRAQAILPGGRRDSEPHRGRRHSCRAGPSAGTGGQGARSSDGGPLRRVTSSCRGSAHPVRSFDPGVEVVVPLRFLGGIGSLCGDAVRTHSVGVRRKPHSRARGANHCGHPEPARRRGREPADPRVEGHPRGRPHPARPRLSSTGSSCKPTGHPRCCATSSRCSATAASVGTGYVSILPGRPGHRALGRGVVRAQPRATSTRRTSSSWPSRAAATRSPPPSACSAPCSRRYAHRIPFIVKLNHNELLTYPNKFDQVMFGSVEQAYDLGAAGVGATIYFGSDESTRQIQEVSEAFAEAHQLGMFTVLWCYLRNNGLQEGRRRLPRRRPTSPARPTTSASPSRPTSSSRSCPRTTAATTRSRATARPAKLVYDELTTDHPIDLAAGRSPTATWAASG